jgi:lipopolysaccharide biosynthesis regulator YciM
VAQNLDNLGQAYKAVGEYTRAIESHQQASVLFSEMGETEEGACNEQNLGQAYAAAGLHTRSVRSLRLAAVTLRRLGHRRREANVLMDLGNSRRPSPIPAWPGDASRPLWKSCGS